MILAAFAAMVLVMCMSLWDYQRLTYERYGHAAESCHTQSMLIQQQLLCGLKPAMRALK